MVTYTLHVPADAASGEPGALERAELVKDGFVWGAFFFTFLWFFWRRLWLAGLLVMLAVIGLAVALAFLRVGAGTAFLAHLLLAILIGLEANSLRRWTLRRRKPAVDVVSGTDRDEAEARSFARWLARRAVAPAAQGPARPAASREPLPVIGLFPDREPPR